MRLQAEMRKRLSLIVSAGVVVAAAVVVAAFLVRMDTSLDLEVRDAVSGRWVWNVSMLLQNRLIVWFYQSDAGLKLYRFTHLTPGMSTLEVTAPGYQDVRIPVSLGRGANRANAPISMVALGIPDLAKFFVFEKLDSGDIVGELRPVSSAGAAITNHPCMDLWVGCRISVQVKDGVPVREETPLGSTRGKELFRGEIPWTWMPAPERQFRYTFRIAKELVHEDPSLYRVVDYLIVEPNPTKITRKELGDLMTRLYATRELSRVTDALDQEKDRLRYFIDTSWNVAAR